MIDRGKHARPKIMREGCCHSCWPPAQQAVAAETAFVLTIGLAASAGAGGGGGAAGSGGSGRITTFQTNVPGAASDVRTWAANGSAGTNGDAGTATARLSGGEIVFGTGGDQLSIQAQVAAANPGRVDGGVPAIPTSTGQTQPSDAGRFATPGAPPGAVGTVKVEITGNRIAPAPCWLPYRMA